MWLPARIRGVYEPVAVLLMSIWLSYSSWTTAQHHMTEAACLGAILGGSFLVALFLTVMGLTFGGRWREIPPGMSWSFYQKLAVVRYTCARTDDCS